MNQVIEPEHKHEVKADIEVRNTIHQRNTNLVANVFADIEVPPNFPVHRTAANERPEGPAVRPNEDEQLINKGKAVFDKCMKVVMKMGFPEDQGSQLCTLLTESMLLVEQEQQESNSQQGNNPAGNSTDTRPPPTGFVGSNANTNNDCARRAALNKEIEIKTAQLEKLNIEVAKEREAHLQRVARIAELEKQNHRLGLESYLRKHIDSENMVHYQAMKFASKGFTVDDLKDIYEDIPVRRIASNVQHIPKSKVRLRTASTDESNTPDRQSHIQHTNEKLTNAYLGNNDLYDDYIA